MEIRRLSLAEGVRSATGLTVIVDVIRSFSSEPLMALLERVHDLLLSLRTLGDAYEEIPQ